jgi:hypothetical protein
MENFKELILESTNYGLDVILRYYPDAAEALARKKHFRLRPSDRTPSCSIKLFNNCYIIKDFGSGEVITCFDAVMRNERLEFPDALRFIAKNWQVKGMEEFNKPAEALIEFRPANENEKENERYFDIKDEFSQNDLRELFAEKIMLRHRDNLKYLMDVCALYNLHALNSYTIIKNRKATIIKSTEQYPIYLYDHGDFKKIYQPKAKDKARRFFYIGSKPSNFIFGLKQLEKAYQKHKADLESEESEDIEGNSKKRNHKLKHAFLCSGERDALNVAALSKENFVLCLNSESAKLEDYDYNKISEKVENLYNIPDIDATGREQGHKMAMEHLDIKTIWLPYELSLRRDFRGNKCKDVRDFFRHYELKQFDDLVRIALPYRFWDLEPKFDKDKVFKRFDYQFNNLRAYNFLYMNGYSRFKDKNAKDGYIFTHVNGDVVKEVLATDIKDFLNDFLADIKADERLRNMVFKTSQVKEGSIGNLQVREIEFNSAEKDFQYMFFQNKTWKVSKNHIEEFKPGVVNKFVWDDEVIKKDVNVMHDFFKVNYDATRDKYDIEILDDTPILFKFLINTANMHWRVTELGVKESNGITRTKLTEEEENENKLHLINRLYALGYLMHRYKDASKAWCVYGMENKVTEEALSNGGSGKSIFMSIPTYFMKWESVNGRDKDFATNKHWSENINEFTGYLKIDDAHQYFDFQFFFNLVTDNFPVNPKHAKSYSIPFVKSPKMSISSNFALKNQDQSTLRRLLFTVFSDYYHHGPNDEFATSRTPKDDFGKQLFTDFDDKDWNETVNLVAQCIRLFLSFGKIEPPMVNVQKRALIGEMGDAFLDWADVYFSKASGNLNKHVVKEYAFNDFITQAKVKLWTTNKFKKALNAYCKFRDLEFNPQEYCQDTLHDRIIGNIIEDGKSRTVEMIHLRTVDYRVENNINGVIISDTSIEKELPF